MAIKRGSRKRAVRKGRFKTRMTKRSARTKTVSVLATRMRRIERTIEVKSGVQKYSDGLELQHNTLTVFSNTMLFTANGTRDREDAFGERIGDKISLRNVTVKGMLELNKRYSDVSVKVIVIKSAKGDEPTQDTLWQGSSGKEHIGM